MIDSTPPTITVAPPITAAPTATWLPTSTPIPADSGWRLIRSGLEYRELNVMIENRSDRLRMARVDPKQVRFRVRYEPDRPRRVGEWFDSDKTLLVVNGGYFDPQKHALGLLISNGQVFGQSYRGFGGMFAINSDGVKIRWNIAQPYVDGEGLTYALQNFPMLVIPGGAPNTQIDDNQQLALRTAVGQDRSGRIVFVVSPGGIFTLTGLGQWLAASDLDLDAALNLDGGSSSGLLLRAGDQTLGVDSWVDVPDVIVVEAK
ncbi:MAG TPA: phosphodiester glycosidase family protein [Anaerolineae bacterium]